MHIRSKKDSDYNKELFPIIKVFFDNRLDS